MLKWMRSKDKSMRNQNGDKGGDALMFGARKTQVLSKQQKQVLLLLKSAQTRQFAEELYLLANNVFEQAIINLHADARISQFRKQCAMLSANDDLVDNEIKEAIYIDYLNQSFKSKDEIELWLGKTLQPNHFPKNDQGVELMKDYLETGENDLQQKLLFGSSAVKEIHKESHLDIIEDATFSVAIKMLNLEQDTALHTVKPFEHKDHIQKLRKLSYYKEKDFEPKPLSLNIIDRANLQYAFEKTCKEADVYQALADIRDTYNLYASSALIAYISSTTDIQLLIKSLPEFQDLEKIEISTPVLRTAISTFVRKNQNPDQFGTTLLKCAKDHNSFSLSIKPKNKKPI